MMAFLHHVVNGNGVLDRIGSLRMDLCLRYGGRQPVTMGMELRCGATGSLTRWTRGWRSWTSTWLGWGWIEAGW